MAVYPNLLTTNAGMDLISRSNATGKGINYTHVDLGDGELGTNNIMNMTNLISPKMTKLEITSKINHGNGHYEIEAQVDNSSLNTGFWAREMGVFAKCEGDSDRAIVLFAYTNGGNYVPYVNDKTRPDIQLCQVDMVVGNATNLDAIIDPKTYVTNARLTSVLNAHNTATNAHDNLFTQYLKKSGGTMTGDLKVLNKVLTDNSLSAASTKFVQDLLSSFMKKGQVNFNNFKNSVANTFESDFSNPNTWWCKFPNELIIQGINVSIGYAEMEVRYPITLNKYLGSLILSHDYFDGKSAKTIERLTKFSSGRIPNELTQIGFRKVNIKDSTPYINGGANIIIFGF